MGIVTSKLLDYLRVFVDNPAFKLGGVPVRGGVK
jgi:hypothetical protein